MNLLLFLMTVSPVSGGEGREARENFFLAFIPHNPLIRLDSDERIQGNPR
jgi:hypothetical protein